MDKKEMYRIGHANDTHRLVEGRKLILGGLEIPYKKGLLGHSDADVLLHAISEAIIGALGMGDLGEWFSDKDERYKDMPSSYFVSEVYRVMDEKGYMINNLDATVYLEEPNLVGYKDEMKKNIASLLHTEARKINIKATRGEGLGYIGKKEGISAEAVCLIVLKPLQKI